MSGATVRELPFAELPDYAKRLVHASIGWRVIDAKRERVIVIETDRDLGAYEDAVSSAREILLRRRPMSLTPSHTIDEIAEADDALKLVLTGTDRFWLRWSEWRDRMLPKGHPNRVVYR